MSANIVASVWSRSRSWPRAKPSSITTFRPCPMTSTIAAESTIATKATAIRARYGRRRRKSGRSLRSVLTAPLDDRAPHGAADGEGAAILRHLRADLEVQAPVELALGAHVHGTVAAQHAALQHEVAVQGARVGAAVLAGELDELGHAGALPGRVRLHHGDQVDVGHRAVGDAELALRARVLEQELHRRALGGEVEVAVELAGDRDVLGEGGYQLLGHHLGQSEVAVELDARGPAHAQRPLHLALHGARLELRHHDLAAGERALQR